ncbi:MAG: hypothetical protein H6712_08395 [Myxococcales bacterium]|nr:hypothetical protein [Myxococcales bacterium]MCB9713858.1 hypothetical protein [Myxococcales bacterium]
MSKTLIIPILAILAAPSLAHASNQVGKVTLDMELGVGGGRELVIREPSMCEAEGDSRTDVKWNRNADSVEVRLHLEGVPYRPSFCFDVDPSTPYNTYPLCVDEGRWQGWFVNRFFTRTSNWYYDSVTGDLIANEFDLPGGPPPGSIPVELPAAQMMCTGFFDPNPSNLKVHYQFDFGYHHMVDFLGSPGTLVGILPYNLFDPSSIWLYYTYEILPQSEAQDFDTTLAELEAGVGGFSFATSLEPVPKPTYLLTHDELMIGWTESYPDYLLEPLPDEAFEDPDCGTEQIYVPFI